MKNKNYRLIPLLLTLPFLMANSPAPEVFSDEYKDYEITYVKEEIVDKEYVYTYHLNNTGTGYISSLSLDRETRVNDEYVYYGLYYGLYSGDFFYKTVIPPGFDQDIEMTSNSKIPEVEKLKKSAQAYNIFDKEATYSGSKVVTPKERNAYSELDHYYYSVDLKIDHPTGDNWHYGFILDITYDGINYFVKIDEMGGYILESHDELDLDKLVINNAVVIKSRPFYYGVDTFFNIFITVLVVGFFLMISLGIFAAIFFPIMARRRRARRLALANQKNDSSKIDK